MSRARARRPFERSPFDELPERPHRPHGYGDAEPLDLEIDAAGFGPMRVHVRKFGSGPPLLLVHGLMTSSYSWRYAFEPLGARYTCYAPDLPAAGRSDAPLAPRYGPTALARWLGEVQEALGIRGCRVIGNSMGGYLAMHLALIDPRAVSRLVNLHSPGVADWRLRAVRLGLSTSPARAALSWLIRRAPERWAHRHVHYYDETLKSREEAREYGAPLATTAGATGLIKYLTETMSPAGVTDFHRKLAERRHAGQPFPCPLLHIYAREDPMVPPRFGPVLAAATGSPLVWLEEASHFAHVDAPERFAEKALEFLK